MPQRLDDRLFTKGGASEQICRGVDLLAIAAPVWEQVNPRGRFVLDMNARVGLTERSSGW